MVRDGIEHEGSAFLVSEKVNRQSSNRNHD